MKRVSKSTNYLTKGQLATLCQMMFFAFVEIRMHARNGDSEEARILAHIFHNVPIQMFEEGFDICRLRECLVDYQTRFGDFIGFVQMIDKSFNITDSKASTGRILDMAPLKRWPDCL